MTMDERDTQDLESFEWAILNGDDADAEAAKNHIMERKLWKAKASSFAEYIANLTGETT